MSLKESVASKKLWFSIGAIAVLYVFARVASDRPTMAPLYDTFAGSVLGVCALYLAGNVTNKLVLSKAPKKPDPKDDDPNGA